MGGLSYNAQGFVSHVYARGGVIQGGDISDYSGSIVDAPTLFSGHSISAYASGGNVMGEAGPEAILPLRRGADGKLGVASSGTSGGVTVNVTTNVDASGSASTSVSSSDQSSAYTALSQ
jgi:lambda family phage tail tape measure protein